MPAADQQFAPQIAASTPACLLCLFQQLTEPHFLVALGLQFTGSLLVPKSGRYVLHLNSLRRARLWLDGYLLIDQVSVFADRAGQQRPGIPRLISLPPFNSVIHRSGRAF